MRRSSVSPIFGGVTMAVYTPLSNEQIGEFLSNYDCGSFLLAEGILQGIDNTNYRIETTQGRYVLTIFESRIDPRDLPFFLDFMAHVADCGVSCPDPIVRRDGDLTGKLAGKIAVLMPFLSGHGVSSAEITPELCCEFGALLGHLHIAGLAFDETRKNSMGLDAWKTRIAAIGERGEPEVMEVIQGEIAYIESNWPENLPKGAVHADLFPDNVFVTDGHVSGVIDFYFSATEFLAYDLAIAVNAWCFDEHHEFVTERWESLMDGYSRLYKMSDDERGAFNVLLRGAALRFLVSRLHDFVFHDPAAFVAPKDPSEYLKKLEFHRHARILPC